MCVCSAYKLHAGVVDEEVLNFDSPVWSEFEVSAALRWVAHVAPPGIDVFHLVKVSRVNQHVQTVLTETSGREGRAQMRKGPGRLATLIRTVDNLMRLVHFKQSFRM